MLLVDTLNRLLVTSLHPNAPGARIMRLTRTPGPIGPAELAPSSAAATGREHAPRFTVAAGRSRRSTDCAEYRPGRLQLKRQHADEFELKHQQLALRHRQYLQRAEAGSADRH